MNSQRMPASSVAKKPPSVPVINTKKTSIKAPAVVESRDQNGYEQDSTTSRKSLLEQLQGLAISVLNRDQANSLSVEAAHTIQDLTSKAQGIVYPEDSTAGRLFSTPEIARAWSSKSEKMVPAEEFIEVACSVYEKTISALPKDWVARLNAPVRLEFPLDHKGVRWALGTISQLKQRLAYSDVVDRIGLTQALWMSSRILSIVTPPRQVSAINECVFCHRHTELRTACAHHRVEGKYTASPTQRWLYANALDQVIDRITNFAQSRPNVFRKLMQGTTAQQWQDNLNELCRLVLPPGSAPAIQQAFKNAYEELAKASGRRKNAEPASDEDIIQSMVRSWHKMPDIDDPVGVNELKQSNLPVFLQFFGHVVRQSAYMSMGQDVPRRRFNRLDSQEERHRLIELREMGMTQSQAAKEMGISLTQARSIESQFGWENRRGRPPKVELFNPPQEDAEKPPVTEAAPTEQPVKRSRRKVSEQMSTLETPAPTRTRKAKVEAQPIQAKEAPSPKRQARKTQQADKTQEAPAVTDKPASIEPERNKPKRAYRRKDKQKQPAPEVAKKETQAPVEESTPTKTRRKSSPASQQDAKPQQSKNEQQESLTTKRVRKTKPSAEAMNVTPKKTMGARARNKVASPITEQNAQNTEGQSTESTKTSDLSEVDGKEVVTAPPQSKTSRAKRQVAAVQTPRAKSSKTKRQPIETPEPSASAENTKAETASPTEAPVKKTRTRKSQNIAQAPAQEGAQPATDSSKPKEPQRTRRPYNRKTSATPASEPKETGVSSPAPSSPRKTRKSATQETK